MTLNLSGRDGLTWGLSSANVDIDGFLGDFANKPAVANLLKNSISKGRASPEPKPSGAERRGSFSGERLDTSYCEHYEGMTRTNSKTVSPAESKRGRRLVDDSLTIPISNGLSSRR